MDKKTDDLEAVRIMVETLEPFGEEDRSRIIRWACEKLGSTYTPVFPAQVPAGIMSDNSLSEPELTQPVDFSRKITKDIKAFVIEKDPQNDKQFAAVVAYYYAFEAPENKKKQSINSADIIDACRLVDRHRPKRPDQTLVNTAHSGFLDKAEEAGSYKLNAVGENLVAMTLPGGKQPRKTARKTTPTKKTSKKVAKKPTKKVAKKGVKKSGKKS